MTEPHPLRCETCEKFNKEKQQQIVDVCPLFSSPYILGLGGYRSLIWDLTAKGGCASHSSAKESNEKRIKELEDLIRLKDIDIKNFEEGNERLEELIECDIKTNSSSADKVLVQVKRHLDDVIGGRLPCGEDDRSLSTYCAIRALIEGLEIAEGRQERKG